MFIIIMISTVICLGVISQIVERNIDKKTIINFINADIKEDDILKH